MVFQQIESKSIRSRGGTATDHQIGLKSKLTIGELENLFLVVRSGIEGINWSDPLQFYDQILIKDINNTDAWLGKGVAILYTSKRDSIRVTDAIKCWKNAIKYAVDKDVMKKRVARVIHEEVKSLYVKLENIYLEYDEDKNSIKTVVSNFLALNKALQFAIKMDEKELTYLETGFQLCLSVFGLVQVIGNPLTTKKLASYMEEKRVDLNSTDYHKEKEKSNRIYFELETTIQSILEIKNNYIRKIKNLSKL